MPELTCTDQLDQIAESLAQFLVSMMGGHSPLDKDETEYISRKFQERLDEKFGNT